MALRPFIDQSSMPDPSQQSFNFLDSTFFKVHGSAACLPTPKQVLSLAEPGSSKSKPPPVKFEHLNLLVKFGPHVSVNEAQCLWTIRKTFDKRIPVPEVYGWRIDGRQVFIYMQLIHGQSLRGRWDSLATSDRVAICHDLQDMLTALRHSKLSTDHPFVGSISFGPVTDRIFEGMPGKGPFSTVTAFHDWLSALLWRGLPNPQEMTDPWRSYLPDDEAVILTHGDLHRGNIIISNTSPPRIAAIIDWEQAGWYPAYWEYCKACYTASYKEDWRNIWIPKLLETREDEFFTLSEYVHAIGSV